MLVQTEAVYSKQGRLPVLDDRVCAAVAFIAEQVADKVLLPCAEGLLLLLLGRVLV